MTRSALFVFALLAGAFARPALAHTGAFERRAVISVAPDGGAEILFVLRLPRGSATLLTKVGWDATHDGRLDHPEALAGARALFDGALADVALAVDGEVAACGQEVAAPALASIDDAPLELAELWSCQPGKEGAWRLMVGASVPTDVLFTKDPRAWLGPYLPGGLERRIVELEWWVQ